MRLYHHPESDSLFWDEFCSDPFAHDVTNFNKFRIAAKERGLIEPDNISEVVESRKPAVTGYAKGVIDSYKTWERRPADLYPTPVDGTESIIAVLKSMKRPDGKPIKRIWEPACGDGRLARVLEWHGFDVVATDIRDLPGYGTGGIDFLNASPLKYGWLIGEIDAIVTNPPFSLAEEFIRRALSITPNVGMLLKQTYWNVGGRSKSLWFDHMPDLECKLTWRLAFLEKERGKSPLMDCMWNFWNGTNAGIVAGPDCGLAPLCIAEPVQRLKYQGYAGIGVRSGTEVCAGEVAELTSAIAAWRERLNDA